MNEISLHKTIDDQTTLPCGKEIEIQDDTKEVGHAWMERIAIVRAYDVAMYEAGTNATD